jgi:hypothetical protein
LITIPYIGEVSPYTYTEVDFLTTDMVITLYRNDRQKGRNDRQKKGRKQKKS